MFFIIALAIAITLHNADESSYEAKQKSQQGQICHAKAIELSKTKSPDWAYYYERDIFDACMNGK